VRKTDYSSIASYYDEARPEPAEIWIRTIVDLAGITPDSSVLDVGCGTGRFAVRVRRYHKGASYGIDSSVEMLKRAAARQTASTRAGARAATGRAHRPIRWLAGDAHSLPLKSCSVDRAYMTMVIHHIERPGAALREIRRVLGPGGRLLILTSSHSSIRAHVLRHFPGVVATDLKRFPTIPTLKAAMRRAGFKNVRSRLVRYHEKEIPVEKYLRMVENKYISTFTVMDDRKFDRGLKAFEKKLAGVYGKTMSRTLAFTFVSGDK
jgi:ubiquinone/menaquinone biosynthesis C-methylase UbiE